MTNILVKMTYIVYVNRQGRSKMKTRLKELRARDGYNQTQLAKKAGVSRQTISLIERNDFMPSVLTAAKIARIFGESIENVFILEEEDYE